MCPGGAWDGGSMRDGVRMLGGRGRELTQHSDGLDTADEAGAVCERM